MFRAVTHCNRRITRNWGGTSDRVGFPVSRGLGTECLTTRCGEFGCGRITHRIVRPLGPASISPRISERAGISNVFEDLRSQELLPETPVLADHPDYPLHAPWRIDGNTRSPAMRVPCLSQHPACPAFGHLIAAKGRRSAEHAHDLSFIGCLVAEPSVAQRISPVTSYSVDRIAASCSVHNLPFDKLHPDWRY
jgi:hypothetical protein